MNFKTSTFVLLLIVMNSCNSNLGNHEKNEEIVSFSEYLNKLKDSNLPYEFKGYNYMNIRYDDYRLEFPDGAVVFFNQKRNCNINIKRSDQESCQNKYTKEELEEKTVKIVEKFLKYNIALLETNDFRFKIHVNKKYFIQNSLPYYDTENNRQETNVVLVFLYKDTLQDSIAKKVLEYYNPIHVDEKWYYYVE